MPSEKVTQLLHQVAGGNRAAVDELTPLVYQELKRIAGGQLKGERPGHTLQATALVHEAYLRLVGPKQTLHWSSRGHFFAAAAEAMRPILVEQARRKKAEIHGGDRQRVELREGDWASRATPDEMVALDESLSRLATQDQLAAEVVKLRLFAGLAVDEAARCMGVSRATAFRHWTYGRAWLLAERGLGNSSSS